VLVTIDLDAASIARLTALGWLAADRLRDRDAVSTAFAAFTRDALGIDEGRTDPPRPLAPPKHQATLGELLSAALARRRSAAS
jgi:hypothetical protein